MNVIGVWSVNNAASLNLYEIRYGVEDECLIGINDEEPQWTTVIHHNSDDAEEGDSENIGVMYGEEFYSLSECMRA